MDTEAAAPEATAPKDARDAVIATLRASDLLGRRGIVRIEHEGALYTLRLTRNNRLILTK